MMPGMTFSVSASNLLKVEEDGLDGIKEHVIGCLLASEDTAGV